MFDVAIVYRILRRKPTWYNAVWRGFVPRRGMAVTRPNLRL